MSDLREKQPDKVTFDYRAKTFGTYTWRSEMSVHPYSSMKNETVYPRSVHHLFSADDIQSAVGIALMMSATIKQAHDVWEVHLTRIGINQDGHP